MVPSLIAVAERAQDISAALDKFLVRVDDQSPEIAALMSECLSTSSALRDLDRKISDEIPYRRYPLISRDLLTVKDSLNYTFDDVRRLFGGLARVSVVPNAEYGYVWQELCSFFRRQSGNPLQRRLEIYCIVLEELSCTLTEGSPRDPDYFEELIVKIERLLDEQHDNSLVGAIDGIDLDGPVVPRLPSFERRRPRDEHIPPPPRPEPYPYPRGEERGNYRYPDREDEYPRGGAPRPPPAPDIPGSSSSNSFSTQSSNLNSVLSSHWLPEVFHQHRPSTLLEGAGQSSIFLASPMPGSSTRLEDQGYNKLLEQPFENGDLLVRLYQRSHDCRARFLCRTIRPARSSKDAVLPLVSLEVSRIGPFLKFYDVIVGELWACLKFSNYEHMVLFFCAFLALRSEDLKTPVDKIRDHDLHKEKELFGGRIVDDHYEHALRLFQEKDTGVIRLQASVQTGPLKRKPIWTAFITHQILSPTWMRRDGGSRVVHIADLQRYVFTDEYNPQRTPEGTHELTFIHSNDAREFEKIMKELVRREEARRRH